MKPILVVERITKNERAKVEAAGYIVLLAFSAASVALVEPYNQSIDKEEKNDAR